MIRLIAATDLNKGLAKNNHIPWRLPEDAKHFRDLTLTNGANVLMGRKTYEQLGDDYLSVRHCYISSHQDIKLRDNCRLVNNLENFLKDFKQDIWVIGGSEIYKATINRASELYLTIVQDDFDCDRFFPDYQDFSLIKRDGPNIENSLTYYYELWQHPAK